jgi:hypothetical protein
MQLEIKTRTAEVESLTALALSSPQGLKIVVESLGGLEVETAIADWHVRRKVTGKLIPSPLKVRLMHAIAVKTLPSEWTWRIEEPPPGPVGQCQLIIDRAPEAEYQEIQRGLYLVRTEVGFHEARKDFIKRSAMDGREWKTNDPLRTYPAVVFMTWNDGYFLYTHPVAMSRLREVLQDV